MELKTFGAERKGYETTDREKWLSVKYIKRSQKAAQKGKRKGKKATIHPMGGVLEIGEVLEIPAGAIQRYEPGTKLYRKQWSRFADDNERYYLYEDHFVMYWAQELKAGARIYRSAVRNIEKYTPEESGKGEEPIRKQKIGERRPDQGKQAKLF